MTDSEPTDGTAAAVRACRRELPAAFDGGRLVFGFDGVVDRVRTMVDTRHGAGDYDRLRRLTDLRERLTASISAESSLTIEWESAGVRTGGHACHLARAFTKLGADTTMIGTYGRPPRDRFETEFADARLVSVGAPGVCDAVEFDDGKLLLTEPGDVAVLDWDRLTDRVDVDTLADHLDGRDVLGVGYWNVMSSLPALVERLVAETWPLQTSPPARVFVDPGDVRNLPVERLRRGAEALRRVDRTVPVTVSANRAETEAIAAVADDGPTGAHEADARTAFDALGVDQFVAHGPSRTVALDGDETVTVEVPTTSSPELTTSAGDHFNVGFLLGEVLDLSLPAATVAGNATAGSFVRTGTPPEYERIVESVETYLDLF